jgi:hypothetical protein
MYAGVRTRTKHKGFGGDDHLRSRKETKERRNKCPSYLSMNLEDVRSLPC